MNVYWTHSPLFQHDFVLWAEFALRRLRRGLSHATPLEVRRWFYNVNRSIVSPLCMLIFARANLCQREYKHSATFDVCQCEEAVLTLRIYLLKHWRAEWFRVTDIVRPHSVSEPATPTLAPLVLVVRKQSPCLLFIVVCC